MIRVAINGRDIPESNPLPMISILGVRIYRVYEASHMLGFGVSPVDTLDYAEGLEIVANGLAYTILTVTHIYRDR